MKLEKRMYKPGDEVEINKLYKMITGIDRSIEKYRWEWLKTWSGVGSIYLLFDKDRKPGDQLICQYSLIPIPFSIFGNYCLGAKTENCMSHPEYRGQGVYFPHERENFEKAKLKFKLFLTSTGKVAKGAPGAIRRKLGYIPFDDWIKYAYYIDKKTLRENLNHRIRNEIGQSWKIARYFLVPLIYLYVSISRKDSSELIQSDPSIKIVDKNHSPVKELELFWNVNKEYYGITVYRSEKYLKWRIDENPNLDYKYLLMYNDEHLDGYAIFYTDKLNNFRIVDLLVTGHDENKINKILDSLKIYTKREQKKGIIFPLLKQNKKYQKILLANKFIRPISAVIKNLRFTKSENVDFYVYLNYTKFPREKMTDHNQWYITELVKEGR
jgi:hypothetical protein